MSTVAYVLVALIALLHILIAAVEMFAWESLGPRLFKSLRKDMFTPTKAMAANQGLYNGFLAAGLIWALMIGDVAWQSNVASCFLVFVAVAGAYGATSVSRTILWVQTVPAVLALAAVWLV